MQRSGQHTQARQKNTKKFINMTFTGKGSRDYSPDWNLSCLIGHEAIKNIQHS